MKTRLLRKVRRRIGYKYRILTRRNKHKIHQIWNWRGSHMGWSNVSEQQFWANYRWEMISEAKKILGDRIFRIKMLG